MGTTLSEELRTIIASSMDGFLLINTDGRILEANNNYCRLVGYTRDQLITMHISGINTTDSKDDNDRLIKTIIQMGTLRFKTRHLCRDNFHIDVEVSATYSPLHGGTIYSFIRDITPQRLSFDIISTRLRLFEYSLDHSINELLTETLDEAESLTGSCIGFYHFLDEDQQTLTLHAWSTRTITRFCKSEGSGSHYPISKAGVWVDCVRERRAVIHNDFAALPHRKGMPAGHATVVRELVVPVYRGNNIVAVMGIGNKPTDYSQQDVDTATLLAYLAWDVVERKQAEEQLRQERDRAQSYLDTVETMIVALDEAGRIITINRKACQTLGYGEDELLGAFWFDTCLPQPEGVEKWYPFLVKLQDGENIPEFEYQENNIVTRSGELRRIAWHNSILRNDQGLITGTLSAGEDITERSQTERELHKLYQAVEQCPATIAITDLDGNLEYVNPAFYRMTGYHLNEVLGRNLRMLKSGVTSAEEYRCLWETITGGKTWYGEFCNKKKNGEYYWEKACIAPIVDKDGAIKNFVAIKEDISKQKEQESEKIKLEAQLRQAQKMESVGRLAGGVAHDFNNILMIIKNFTFLSLLELDPSGQVHSFLNEISKATERAIALTSQLLAFARKQTIAPKVVDMNAAVAEMLYILQRLIGEDIQLTWQPEEELWPVKLDPSQVDQILANLCVNSRDAIKGVGRIVIKTENHIFEDSYCSEHTYVKPGDYVLLSVIDNGCGMNKETLANIFEPFFTTKELGKGTGLGLATVYGIVKQNHGVIEVASQPDSGTTFNVYLPRYLGEERAAQLLNTEEPVPRGNENILLVEDNADILKTSAKILEKLGYSVLSAHDYEEALLLAREHNGTIQLLITDVVMPHMNGKELADNLKLLYPQLRCLFMSGYTADIISGHAVLDNGVNFIQKPFSLSEIAVKVRTLLDS